MIEERGISILQKMGDKHTLKYKFYSANEAMLMCVCIYNFIFYFFKLFSGIQVFNDKLGDKKTYN
jgi:hypothetical protein